MKLDIEFSAYPSSIILWQGCTYWSTLASAILNMPVKYIPMAGGLLILREVSADSIFLQFKRILYLVACPCGVVCSNRSIIIVHYKK